MKSYTIKDLMVPLSEYATVSEDASLYDAVLSLEDAQEQFEDKHTRYRHRAIQPAGCAQSPGAEIH